MNATRRKADITPPRQLTPGTTEGNYKPDWIPVRPGSQDHEQIPSLHQGVRYYRDGRKESA